MILISRKIFYVIFAGLLFLVISCSEDVITQGSINSNQLGKNIDERSDTISSIVKIDKWMFNHYKAEKNKKFGIWPQADYLNLEKMKELKNKWGFNYMFFQYSRPKETFDLILSAGYKKENIMVSFFDFENHNHQWIIDSYPGVYAFYSDEPQVHDYDYTGIYDYINDKSPGTLFITSGYKRTRVLKEYIDEADKVFFPSYKHWYELFGFWVSWPENLDQRSDWTDMKNRHGEKSSGNWIAAHKDQEEFFDLLEHGTSLELDEIWFYQHQNGLQEDLENYCIQAWKTGWLNKHERKYIYTYQRTLGENGKKELVLLEIIPTEEYRIVKFGEKGEYDFSTE